MLNEEQLGPEWFSPRQYSDGSTLTVHSYQDAAAAKEGVKNLADNIPTTSTTTTLDVSRYTREDDQRRGMLIPVENRVIQIEADDDSAVDERLESLPFISENPEKNLVYVLFTQHLGAFFLGLGVYLVLYAFLLFRGGTWAASISPAPGVPPSPAETLRAQLLAVNDLDLPF